MAGNQTLTFTLAGHSALSIELIKLAGEQTVVTGLPWSEKSQGKTKIMVREKSGKIFDIVKVSEKLGNSVFWFIVHKFSSRF